MLLGPFGMNLLHEFLTVTAAEKKELEVPSVLN